MARPETLSIRNQHFATNAASVPRAWHGGRQSISTFFNNLSLFFPAGERFFIASVNAHRHHVSDPRLLQQVQDFCAQEAIHGREHRRYNEMLEEQGYPVTELEGRVERLLAWFSRRTPRRMRLAATCALEHLTATLAHLLLTDPTMLEGAHPTMAALWRWHAAEEIEHKAVAFDVHLAVGGTRGERALVMVVASVIFWAKVLEQQVHMMRADGTLGSLREWGPLLRFMFVEPGGMGRLFRHHLDYYRSDFHPWQLDNHELVRRFGQTAMAAPLPAAGPTVSHEAP